MTDFTRRSLLKAGAGSALALSVALPFRGTARAAQPEPRIVAESAFAKILEVGDGLYAVMSTPLDASGQFAHPQTLCNGGLILGDERVVSIDGYYQPAGAAWVNQQAIRLFGRPVSDVIFVSISAFRSRASAIFMRPPRGDSADLPQT